MEKVCDSWPSSPVAASRRCRPIAVGLLFAVRYSINCKYSRGSFAGP